MAGTMDANSPFQDYVLERMKELEIKSLRQLAEASNLSQGFLSNVMNREKPLSVKAARKLAIGLQRPVEEVERWAGIEPVKHEGDVPMDRLTRMLMNIAKELEPEDREVLLDTARAMQRRNVKKAQAKGSPKAQHT